MNQSMNGFGLVTGETPIVLSQAILLHTREQEGRKAVGEDVVYATVHPIQNFGTEARPNFQIAAGTPLTREGIMAMFAKLAKQLTLNVDYLPEGVLSISADHMIWWVPACERNVFFNNVELGKRAAKVPHPPLLFVVVKGQWYVFALDKNERPKPDTTLFHAPYFNVYDDGGICIGSAAVPKGIAANAIPQWEAAFFDSEFTHTNGGMKKSSHPRGEYAMWKELLDGAYAAFPSEYLVPTKASIASLLKSLRKTLGVVE
jgi:PRTRC genetic system protein B